MYLGDAGGKLNSAFELPLGFLPFPLVQHRMRQRGVSQGQRLIYLQSLQCCRLRPGETFFRWQPMSPDEDGVTVRHTGIRGRIVWVSFNRLLEVLDGSV